MNTNRRIQRCIIIKMAKVKTENLKGSKRKTKAIHEGIP